MKKRNRRKAASSKSVKAIACTTPIEEESRQLLHTVQAFQQELDTYYPRMLEEDLTGEAKGQAASLKRASANIKKSFFLTFGMQDELSSRVQDLCHQKNGNLLTAAPANASIDQKEGELQHFARGLNGYKLMLIGLIGSFFGVLIEMLWCLVTNGYIESRAGVVYGPFNPLYGIGTVVLTVCLYKFRNRGAFLSFLGGTIVGSVVEYVCSWGQEFVFGSRSWDYSGMPFNINGRICLLYSMFWGVLGVLWIKNLYPRMAKWILKIPNRVGKIVTWVAMALFILNMAVSGLALTRWTQRHQGIAPANGFWQFVDERFPDERMEKIYANMDFGDAKQ